MYCVPLNSSDRVDFGNMGYKDIENVKFKCDEWPTCKAFYEAFQNGKKSYFGCENKYEKKESTTSGSSHILYLKGIDNFSKKPYVT